MTIEESEIFQEVDTIAAAKSLFLYLILKKNIIYF